MKTICILVILCLVMPQIALAGKDLATESNTSIRIAFGSCMKPHLNPDSILNSITDSNPDVFVWLGDVAYTDTRLIPIPSSAVVSFSGEEKYRAKLQETKNHPSYQRLRNRTQIVGVWDDHDYGINGGTISFKFKEITQPIWLDFIDEPADSPRRKQKGIWDSYYVGRNQNIKLILLDTRYYKNGRYFGSDTLGEIQWQWLENEFLNNKAELVLIGSGYQILPDERIPQESWFYKSKERLYDLMNKHKVNGVVLMSGDVHTGEIMMNPCSKQRTGYALYEITSSGITHTIPRFMKYFYESWIPPTYHIRDQNVYQDVNFGIIDVNLIDGHVSQISLQIRNKAGNIVREQVILYAALIRDESSIGGHENCIIYAKNPLRRLLGYHFSHFSNFPKTLESKRGMIMYALFLVTILVSFFMMYLCARVCCCRTKNRVSKKEKLT